MAEEEGSFIFAKVNVSSSERCWTDSLSQKHIYPHNTSRANTGQCRFLLPTLLQLCLL